MALSLAALAAGCAAATGPTTPTVLTIQVAPYRTPCVTVMPTQCLLVRELPSGEWQRWYDPIAGFTYEEGFAYTLRVARSDVPNPPADGSSVAYSLIKVLAKTPAP